jgi:hypothetical protein
MGPINLLHLGTFAEGCSIGLISQEEAGGVTAVIEDLLF